MYVFFLLIIEPRLWHVKYLGHGAAGNVMTGIGVIAEQEARLMIVQCGVKIWANVYMDVCMFVKCLVIGPRA